jgi:hypothetical protein
LLREEIDVFHRESLDLLQSGENSDGDGKGMKVG